MTVTKKYLNNKMTIVRISPIKIAFTHTYIQFAKPQTYELVNTKNKIYNNERRLENFRVQIILEDSCSLKTRTGVNTI